MSVCIRTPNGVLCFSVLDSDHDPELSDGSAPPDEVVDWAEALLEAL